jgi:LDH2 family malate/lactate/ureidoglycolate dehydrogenase
MSAAEPQPGDVRFVRPDELRGFASAVLQQIGIAPDLADCVADTLVQANLRGTDTHGVVRLPTYVARFTTVDWQPPEVIRDDGATALVDVHDAMGQVGASMAMKLAIAKAQQFGVGVAGVRNSNHLGAAGAYAMMAAEQNLIGFSSTNASPRIAPWGGKEPLLGNNPLAYAFPTGKGYPLVLDMSISVVAAGKIRTAAAHGEQIPEGWALDRDGRPTRDPRKALEGLLLPIGGHKGYGLSLVIDVLCGVLTGSGFATSVGKVDTTASTQYEGHFMAAIDIARFMPLDEFVARIDRLIDLIKGSARSEGTDEIFLPGEIEYRTSQRRAKEGIPLDGRLVARLNQLAAQVGAEGRLPETAG